MSRIVSLLPSATEIVCALGAGAELVGRSHECDFPAGLQRVPICTEPKVRVDGDSAEVHGSVTAVLENDISVYRVHSALLRELRPDVIITQIQCDICAVSLRDVEASIANWLEVDVPRIVALNPSTLDSIFADVETVGAAIARDSREVVARMRQRVHDIARRAATAATRPRVATIEWISPLMAAGNWIPEIIELAGGECVFGRSGEHSSWIDPVEFARADADVVLAFPCGFSIDRTLADLPLLDASLRDGNLFVADGNQFFNRPGPRIVESVEILAEIIHPELFDFGHGGRAWVRP
ncbi:MAG: cobalamin-binding protein [Thermoanaerobaculia bacterium]